MEGGSVVANRVESGEYRELTTNEVFVCALGEGGTSQHYRTLGGLGKCYCDNQIPLTP